MVGEDKLIFIMAGEDAGHGKAKKHPVYKDAFDDRGWWKQQPRQ